MQALWAGKVTGAPRTFHGTRRCATVSNALVLRPIGDGTTAHIDNEPVPAPQSMQLRDGTLDVGRLPACAVPITIPTVSSRHAILTVEGDKVLVFDVNSTNGTFIDGVACTPMTYIEVPVGAKITFGDEHLAAFLLDKVADEEPATH